MLRKLPIVLSVAVMLLSFGLPAYSGRGRGPAGAG